MAPGRGQLYESRPEAAAAAELLALILLWHYQQAPFKSYYKAGDVKKGTRVGIKPKIKNDSLGKKKVLSEWTGVSVFYQT